MISVIPNPYQNQYERERQERRQQGLKSYSLEEIASAPTKAAAARMIQETLELSGITTSKENFWDKYDEMAKAANIDSLPAFEHFSRAGMLNADDVLKR